MRHRTLALAAQLTCTSPAGGRALVTSGLRVGLQSDAVVSSDTATRRYEDFKSSHKDTRAECEAQGFAFTPMVVWTELAPKSVLAMRELEAKRSCAAMLTQRLSLTLHRESARACLRRFG